MSSSIAGRRFVLAPYGSAGDVYPFLWLGQELQRRGARVVVVSSPVFSKAARSSGLRLIPVGTEEEFHRLAADPDFWHPLKGPWRVLCAARDWFEPLAQGIEKLLRPAHSVLISSAPNFPATFAAKKLRRPQITVHLQPVAVFSSESTPLPGYGFNWFRSLPKPAKSFFFRQPTPVDWSLRPILRRVCRDTNIPVPRSLLYEWWDSPDGVLCFFPEWFAPPQNDWPTPLFQSAFPLFDPFKEESPDAPEHARFAASGDKPIVFTAGSAMGCPADFFRLAAEAINKLGRRAIFVTAYPEALPANLPTQISILRYAAFSRLFPRAAAVVHHGGIGTTAQAFAAGVPQLIVPQSHDQPDNAERVARLGCGISLSLGKLRAGRLAEALQRLLADPRIVDCTKEIAARMPPPGVASDPGPAADAVERFLQAGVMQSQ